MSQVVSAPQSQSVTTQRKWVMASTSAGFALENMDVMFLSFALSSIATDMHLSGTQAGFIATITNLGMLVGGLIFGILGDRFGRVKTFSQTVFIFAFATAAMFFAHNVYMVYACRFIAGIGAGGEYGVGITLIADNFPRKDIGRLTSVAAIGGQVGAVLAAVVAAWVLNVSTWNTLFLVGLVPVVLIVFIRRHVHESAGFLTRKANGNVPHAAVGELFKTPKLTVQTLSLIFMVIVQIAGYFGLMSWLPTIMQAQLHLSVSGSSVWMITTIIGMSLGMMTFGTILDKFGPRRAFGIFLIASALSVFGIAMVNSRGTMLLAGAVVGFFSNGMFGGYGAVISQLYPSAIRSTANNVIVNIGRAIGGFSSVVIGFLMDRYSLMVVMGFLATLYVLSCIVMLSIGGLRQLHTDKQEADADVVNN